MEENQDNGVPQNPKKKKKGELKSDPAGQRLSICKKKKINGRP